MLAEIVEKWTEQWEKQRLVKGRVEGRVEGEVAVLALRLSKRFGPLDEQTSARRKAATPDQLDIWADCILDAPPCKTSLTATENPLAKLTCPESAPRRRVGLQRQPPQRVQI